MASKLKVTTINDEISENLNEVIDFLNKNKIKFVELRTIKKKNLIDYPLEEVDKIYNLLKKNNIKVSAFASPLFKWFPEGVSKNSSIKVDTFGFNPYITFKEKKIYIAKAIQVAKRLHTNNIRIFSTLRTGSKKYTFTKDPLLDFALNEAHKEGVTLMLENEIPCYINSMEHIKSIAKKYKSKNLKIWFDISNFYKADHPVLIQDLKDLVNSIGYFHIKDFDADNNYVPFGTGIINYKRIVSDIRAVFGTKDLFLSIETHVRSNPKEATVLSVNNLKRLLIQKRIKYGVVGCGSTFMKHGSAVSDNEDSELRAVFDINQKISKSVSKDFDCESKKDFKALLNDDMIDIINIRTPNDIHTKLTLDIISKGKYCLCEKPISLTAKEGKKIIDSKYYNKNVFVNYQNRFNPALDQVFEYMRSGKLGKILLCSVSVRWWRDDLYFQDWHGDKSRVGGMLFNQGAHALDLMLKICGEIKVIKKMTSSVRKSVKLDDIFLALVEFKSGVLGNIEVTTHTKNRNFEAGLFIAGEKGSIKIGGPSFNNIEFLSLAGKDDKSTQPLTKPLTESSHFRLIKAINSFLLNGKKDNRLAFADDGVLTVDFIEKLYKSK